MTEDETVPASRDRGAASAFSGLLAFTIRALMVMIVVAIGFAVVLPDTRDMTQALRRELRREETRIRLTGLLTTNPYVHMRVSQIKEKAGNIQGALDEIELAIGLFELHASDRQARQRYVARRDELIKKLQGK